MILTKAKSLSQSEIDMMRQFVNRKDRLVFSDWGFIEVCAGLIKSDLYLYYGLDQQDRLEFIFPLFLRKRGLKRSLDGKLPYDLPYGAGVAVTPVDISSIIPVPKIGLSTDVRLVTSPLSQFYSKIENNRIVTKLTPILDLTQGEEYIWLHEVSSKRRNMINKAKKKGYRVSISSSFEDFDKLWGFLSDLHKRLGYKALTYEYYRALLKELGTDRFLLCLAYNDDRLISGALVIGNTFCYHYYKGASVINPPNDGQGELIQWEIIRHLIEIGVHYYDLCVVDKETLPSIYAFKTGICSNITDYYSYSANSSFSRLIGGVRKWLY